MNRLPFSLPEFTRIIWASERAREVWEPRIRAINDAWFSLERATVVAKIRPGGLQNLDPENLIEFQSFCYDNDLEYAILSREGSSGTYSNASHPVRPGKPWLYRVYFGARPKEFVKAWNAGDQNTVGEFLGYPECCTEFFTKYWQNEHWRDLTYTMSEGGVNGSWACNILLRHLGVRPVFHLPCSFYCEATEKVCKEIFEFEGLNDEKAWIIEMLSWPVKWSSLHGVAIITTPVVKIVASSDALETEAIIEKSGNRYPQEAATGNVFPFTQKPISMLDGIRDTWSDNGFSNLTSMTKAHDVILRSIRKVTMRKGRVLDLGCGNGLLLEKISTEFNMVPFGIESNHVRHRRAIDRLNNIVCENIFDYPIIQSYELGLISINRLAEVDPDEADLFLFNLKNRVLNLCIYAYGSWKDTLDPIIRKHFNFVLSEIDGGIEARIMRSNAH